MKSTHSQSDENKKNVIDIAEKAIAPNISERERNIVIGKAYLDLGLAAYDDNCDDKRQLYAGAGENYIKGTFTVTSEQSKQMYFAIAEKMGTDNISEYSYLPEPYEGAMDQPVDCNQGTANERAYSHIIEGGGSYEKEARPVTFSESVGQQVVVDAVKDKQKETPANMPPTIAEEIGVILGLTAVTAGLVGLAVSFAITPAVIGHALAQAGAALTTSILPAVAAFMLTPTGIGTGIGLLLGTIALVGYLTTPNDKFTVKEQRQGPAVSDSISRSNSVDPKGPANFLELSDARSRSSSVDSTISAGSATTPGN